jgi:protein-disulfide isomerase
MRSHNYLPLAALLILAAPQIATPQASQQYSQVTPPAKAKPAQPVSTVRGSDKAPITVLVFSDFESFPCARSASVIDGLLQQTRDVRVIFKHAPAASNPNAMLAHEAALAGGAQGKFWEMHDTLFENQTHLTRADLLGYAKSLGLDLAAFERALDNHTYRPIVERDLAEAAGLGVTTTPTFFVNGRRLVGPQGYASLGAVIESLLAGIPPDKRVQPEIVAAGPAQQIDIARAPTRGPLTAPISLVEFSDFECPYCAMTAPIVKQLLAAYPAQVRFAFKHYPLPMHKESPLAHEASLAAADQGKFWEMHDALFAETAGTERQNAGTDETAGTDTTVHAAQKARLGTVVSVPFSRDDLIAKAAQLHLDIARFTKDLDTHRFKPQVDQDRQEGNRLGVDGTPFFFINGHAISGGASLQDFKHLIDAALKEAAAPAAKPATAR